MTRRHRRYPVAMTPEKRADLNRRRDEALEALREADRKAAQPAGPSGRGWLQ